MHDVFISVTDECGLQGSCATFVKVLDCVTPSLNCPAAFTLVLDNTGTASINAADYQSGHSDNCTPSENLTSSFSPDISHTTLDFGCADLGSQTIQLWVSDLSGNQNFCEISITIEDNMGICPSNCPTTLDVDDNPISSNTYEASETINSAGFVEDGSNVTFIAGQSISLEENFEVELGGEFEAMIANALNCFNSPNVLAENASEGDLDNNNSPHPFRQPTMKIAPNPVHSIFTLTYEIFEATSVNIGVYDLTGRQIAAPMSTPEQIGGQHEINWDATALQTGIYFVRLQAGTTLISKKMIVVK